MNPALERLHTTLLAIRARTASGEWAAVGPDTLAELCADIIALVSDPALYGSDDAPAD